MLKNLKSFDLKEKRVLIRVDFNVPVEDDKVLDDFRIQSAIPTIQHCLKEGAKVSFEVTDGPKGQQASNIKPAD